MSRRTKRNKANPPKKDQSPLQKRQKSVENVQNVLEMNVVSRTDNSPSQTSTMVSQTPHLVTQQNTASSQTTSNVLNASQQLQSVQHPVPSSSRSDKLSFKQQYLSIVNANKELTVGTSATNASQASNMVWQTTMPSLSNPDISTFTQQHEASSQTASNALNASQQTQSAQHSQSASCSLTQSITSSVQPVVNIPDTSQQSQRVQNTQGASRSVTQPLASSAQITANVAMPSTSQNIIADYTDADEAPIEEDTPVKPPRIWQLEKTYANTAEFELFLLEETCWAKKKMENLSKGLKTSYRCKHVKRAGPQCSHSIYTLEDFEPNNTQIKLFRINWPHDHDGHGNRISTVPYDIQQFITDHAKNNPIATAKTILHRCQEEYGEASPTRKQIENVLQLQKKKQFGSSKTTMADLVVFFNDNKEIPEDMDKAFIVDFDRSAPTEKTKKWFRFFLTTKRLLKNSVDAEIMHADATYRVMVEQYPLIVIGATDKAQSFHLIGLGISKHETTDDYTFMFDAVKNAMARVLDGSIQPRCLVSDAAPAIRNGFKNSFPNAAATIMCFAHVKTNATNQIFKNQKNRPPLYNDLNHLQSLRSKELFDIGIALFEKKWKQKEPELFKTFKNSFLVKYPNWFQGIAVHAPKTNNALEGFNGQIKRHQTFWKRKSLSQFKVRVMQIAEERSREYMCGKQFCKQTPVSDAAKSDALSYTQSMKNFIIKEREIEGKKVPMLYVYSGDEDLELTEADVDAYLGKIWGQFNNFDQFIEAVNRIYEIEFSTDPNDWTASTCTCPQNAKRFICKHVLAAAIHLDILHVEIDFDNEPLEKNKKRGAPKKAPRGRPLQRDV